MSEEWRPINGFSGTYEVSNLGRVRNYGKRILSQSPNWDGRLRVTLTRFGIGRKYYVHKLVAEAFIGSCPEDHEVNHKDLDCKNNVSNNLEYLTRLENIRYSIRMTGNQGNPRTLNREQVEEIRARYGKTNITMKHLAQIYNVSVWIIGDIIHNRTYLTWKD